MTTSLPWPFNYHYEYFATPPCFSFSTPFVSLISLCSSPTAPNLPPLSLSHLTYFYFLSIVFCAGLVMCCLHLFFFYCSQLSSSSPVLHLSFCSILYLSPSLSAPPSFFFLLFVAWWQMPNWMMNVPLLHSNFTAGSSIGRCLCGWARLIGWMDCVEGSGVGCWLVCELRPCSPSVSPFTQTHTLPQTNDALPTLRHPSLSSHLSHEGMTDCTCSSES